MPIPLYRLPEPTLNGDHKAVVKWQTEWQACDEIQMAGACQAEHAALHEIRDADSDIFRRGWDLRGRIEYITKIPTYYYQYRVGGESLESELNRPCPKCGGQWRLDEPCMVFSTTSATSAESSLTCLGISSNEKAQWKLRFFS